MKIKIENIEIVVKSFTIKYSDKFNLLSFDYQTDDIEIINKLRSTFGKREFHCTFLDNRHDVTINSKSINNDDINGKASFKLKLRYK